MLVIATRLRSLKRFFRAFNFLSTYLVFNINSLQILLMFQLIKPATQASCSLCFSYSFTKLASLIFSCLIVKPKSTHFSLINLIIEKSYGGLLRTYLIFLNQRQFYMLILNISQFFLSNELLNRGLGGTFVAYINKAYRQFIVGSLQALL